jgi:hypothetical protein
MAGNYTVLDWDDKDPSEVIKEAVEFVDALDVGDSLLSIAYTFINQAGVTKSGESIDGTKARVTLAAGTVGQTMSILCTATTLAGEVLKQVVKMKIKAKT